ncbi:GIY-YIG nuclease family protein [Dongia sp.]|uniref:GIY-YIG nuclease family protein n=1 Tax=Dongia sp. TaxID=1977262 RepID=UPI0035ADEC1F
MTPKYFYTVYKTTNLLTGHIYIGIHVTQYPFDEYLGSGKRLKEAIEQYGRQHFSKEVLFIYDNPDDMHDKEEELVDEKFLRRKLIYNLSLGGGNRYTRLPWEPPLPAGTRSIEDELSPRRLLTLPTLAPAGDQLENIKRIERQHRLVMFARGQDSK